jgi:hypothetical protein
MYYFAYGSNMSHARLRERAPSAAPLGCNILTGHDLRFHKSSHDGSGKCDAFFTANSDDTIYGALFLIDPSHKPALDKAEGLGYGYDEKEVTVIGVDGSPCIATTYIATHIDAGLKPYAWYVNHVLVGARETLLPEDYIQKKIAAIEAIEDADRVRDALQRGIHR